MRRKCLLDKIRKRTAEQLNGYLDLGTDSDEVALRSLITTSQHGDDAGLVGAINLAQRALKDGVDNKDKKEFEITIQQKREAFNAGLWHGFLIGAIGTAFVVKYGFFGIGGGKNRR